jgi:hypothetical protein
MFLVLEEMKESLEKFISKLISSKKENIYSAIQSDLDLVNLCSVNFRSY